MNIVLPGRQSPLRGAFPFPKLVLLRLTSPSAMASSFQEGQGIEDGADLGWDAGTFLADSLSEVSSESPCAPVVYSPDHAYGGLSGVW